MTGNAAGIDSLDEMAAAEDTSVIDNLDTESVGEEVAVSDYLDTRSVIVEADRSKPLYKCDECAFSCFTTDSLEEHTISEHTKEHSQPDLMFLHSCNLCDFETNDFVELMEHMKEKTSHNRCISQLLL